MKLRKKSKNKKNYKKGGKKLKLLMAVFLSFSIASSMVSCTAFNQKKNVNEFKYTISKEVTNPELIMNNQPTAPHWFPSELLNWTPSNDKNINFNKSTIKLANRVNKDKLFPVNDTQSKDKEIVAISIMNSSTSGNPSQGSNKFSSNVFSYWQYIDKMVYWGGSSGEGLIVPPSADVIDSAHKNGVPVLGTVFFPMTEHGGKIEWLNEFLTKDSNGNFPMVDKLIEVANTYGFDGWFINQETQGTEEEPLTEGHAVLMKDFISQFKEKAKENLELMWYDSMTKDGKMEWQNALTDENKFFLVGDDKKAIADSMFLNFWWTTDKLADQNLLEASTKKADELGINPNKLFAGVDIQQNGINTPIRWDLFEKGNTSLGLYCPSWTYSSAQSIDDFHDKENRLWVNENNDPSVKTMATDKEWKGISTYAIEKTVINNLPFVTNFNLGHGYNFFINGEKVSETDWNNRSMSDIMPTYRWMIKNEGNNKIDANIDYANAFYGGNSIKLSGNLDSGKASTIKLYSADLKLEDKVSFKTTINASKEVNLDLILELHDGSTEILKSKDKVTADTWSTISYDVSKLSGKSIKTISLGLSSDESISGLRVNLGNISITKDAKEASSTNLKVDDKVFDEDGMFAGVKLSWESNKDSDTSHFEIYQTNQDGTKSFLGVTPSNNFFLNALPREGEENTTNFEVLAINKNGERGTSSSASMEWPDNRIPKAEFKISKTLVAPGEEITLENISSPNSETFAWELKGAKVESSTEKSPKVVYDKEGDYTIKLVAKNKSGENTKVLEQVIKVTNEAKELANLSEGKKVEASSFVNNNEAPQFAFDGKTDTKWCATGKAPHSITVDLGGVKVISEVAMAHAEAGGESDGMNTKAYTIEVSENGVDFTEVVNVTRNSAANTLDTFKPVKAKYVRVTAIKPTQNSDSAVRIYEIQVKGIK